MVKRINTNAAPKAIGSYSQGVLTGNILFCSGQIGLTSANKLAGPKVEDQAIQALKNIQAVVKESGFNISNIVKTTIFMTDIADFKKIDKCYSEFLKDVKILPARSAVCVSALPGNAKVEIEVIASK